MTKGLKVAATAGVIAAAGGAFALNADWNQAREDIRGRVAEAVESGDPELIRKVTHEMSKEHFQRVVLPRLKAAKSCRERSDAYSEYVSWARDRELIGATEEPAGLNDALEEQGLDGYFEGTYEKCMEEAYAKCVQEHDVTQIVEMWSLERTRQLMGSGAHDAGPDERIEKCQRFELEFEAETDWELWTPHARAVVALTTADAPFTYEGEAPLTAGIRVDAEEWAPCRAVVSGVSALHPLKIVRLVVDGDVPRDSTGERTGPPKYGNIDVLFNPGNVAGKVQELCDDDDEPAPPTDLIGMYGAGFWTPFQKELVPELPAHTYKLSFTPDEIAKGALFARKTIRRSAEGVTTRLVLTLWHRPE